MSRYQLQKAIYEYLNPRDGVPASTDREQMRARYGLDEDELDALADADVRALWKLGVHPVLLNSYARARVPRERYRAILAELDLDETRAAEMTARDT